MKRTNKAVPNSLQDPRLPIVAIDSSGSVTRVNGPARKVLIEGENNDEYRSLGGLIAGFFSRNERKGGMARLFLSGETDEENQGLAIVLSQEFGQLENPVGKKDAEAKTALDDSREKHKLADYIAHELRNPLGTILALSRILRVRQRNLPDSDRALAVDSIETEAERSLLILEGLLRLVQGRTRSTEEESQVPLHAILRRVVVDHRRRNPERTIILTGDSPMYARGDSVGIELAMGNLLNNAEKYSPRGTKIEISFHQEGNRATILVGNGGTALPPERYRRLWDIYATGPDPEVMVSGSGIGLSLCKELIESMGGRVWAGPAHEGGSVFAVTLPSPWDLTVLDSLDTAISSRPTPWPTLWPTAYAEVGAAS